MYCKMILSVKVHNEIAMVSRCPETEYVRSIHYFNVKSNQCIAKIAGDWFICIAIPMDKSR